MIKKLFVSLAVTAVMILGTGSQAFAQMNIGNVHGYAKFYQHQVNRCTSGCTGAKYTSDMYQVKQPVKNAKIYLKDATTGVLISAGSTSSTGYFKLYFHTPLPLSNVELYWYPEDKSGHFRILNSSGAQHRMWVAGRDIGSGNNIDYNYGTKTWGTQTTASDYANIYDGAQRMYNDGLAATAAMRSKFTNVDIWTSKGSTCSTSCLRQGNGGKLIYMDNNAWLNPIGRVAHEMGHAASYLASPSIRSNNQAYALGCGTDYDGSSGWSPTTEEYRCTAMEEGWATTAAIYAFYYHNATNPRDTGADIEAYPPSCTSAMMRYQRAAVSYLWDIIDNRDDDETIDLDFYHLVDTLALYDTGFGDHDVNEQFNSGWSYNAREGRSPYDFYWNLLNRHPSGADVYSLWQNNCLD